MRIDKNKVRAGEWYWFVTVDFLRDSFDINISKKRVHQVIDGEFTVKNPEDKFAYHTGEGFTSKEECVEFGASKIRLIGESRKSHIDKAVELAIDKIHII